jgi:hypothetical protein
VQELEYVAYGFLAALDKSLLCMIISKVNLMKESLKLTFPTPFCPRVADVFVASPPFEDPAGEP